MVFSRTTLSTNFDLLVTIIRFFYACFLEPFIRSFQNRQSSVKDKIVLITGSGQGIGRELALQYAALQATVLCIDLNEKSNDNTVSKIKQSKGKAHAYKCDVTKREDVFALAEEINKNFGHVDILVNNAAVLYSKSVLHHSEKEIRSIFDVNVLGVFWTLQAFLPSMIKAKDGHVVAICSAGGLQSQANLVPYCATKHALRGIMEGIAAESENENWNLKFTTVYPLFVDTGMCKYPQIRFHWFMGLLDAGNVASEVIAAQRRGEREFSLPRWVRILAHLSHIIPKNAAKAVTQFMGVNVHEDL